MKAHELKKDERFCIVVDCMADGTPIKHYGLFIGCDGAYGKVQWDIFREYSQDNPFDYIGCSTEVEAIL